MMLAFSSTALQMPRPNKLWQRMPQKWGPGPSFGAFRKNRKLQLCSVQGEVGS